LAQADNRGGSVGPADTIKSMRVYVFGAGASVHAGYPLASGIGDALSKWLDSATGNLYCPDKTIEGYKGLILALRKHYPRLEDFEQIVTDWESGSISLPCDVGWKALISAYWSPSDLRSTIADFFGQVPRSANLYRQLAEQNVKHGDVVITFNYDVALERELRLARAWDLSNGYGFEIFQTRHPASLVPVLKLHGSVNWVKCMGGAGLHAGFPFDKPVAIMPQDLIDLGYDKRVDAGFRAGGVDRPNLILPGKEKRFETDLFDPLWSQAELALRHASELVVIGYSFPEADKRATELILQRTNRNAQVTVCCRTDGVRICDHFRSIGFTSVRDADSFESWLSTATSRSAGASTAP